MKIVRNKMVMVMVFALLCSAGSALAGETRFESHEKKMADDLGLSETQKKEMSAFRDKHKTEMKSIREKMKSEREALRAMLDSDKPDMASAKKLTEEMKKTFSRMVDLRLEGAFHMRNVLTEDQFRAMKEKRNEHQKMRGKRRQHNADRQERDNSDEFEDDEEKNPPREKVRFGGPREDEIGF